MKNLNKLDINISETLRVIENFISDNIIKNIKGGKMDKDSIRNQAFKFLSGFGTNIGTKLSNICAKTGQYNVPNELFQKRTPRSNRVLISWKTVKNNNLSIEQLNCFEGGVVVEFLNNDFFDEENNSNETFLELKNRIGSDDNVSAIISIRSEGGSSSSMIQREVFAKLINNTRIVYKGEPVVITQDNYNQYKIKQLMSGGTGNEKWSGFLFVSIKGGQQDTIETHHDEELTIFNPACEYASKKTRKDIDLVVSFFVMKSIDIDKLNTDKLTEYNQLILNIQQVLKECEYSSQTYNGNLLDYCLNHPSIKMISNHLTDPIQLKKIEIKNFDTESRIQDSVDFTHDEAVTFEKFYWDSKQNTILSPARPTNIFWSFHLSNMMQQDYTLTEYFKYEKERYEKRQQLLNK